jgi:hypothetical protein
VRDAQGRPLNISGWVLECKDLDTTVGASIEASIVSRARALGLEVSTTDEKYSIRGPPVVLEVITITRGPR